MTSLYILLTKFADDSKTELGETLCADVTARTHCYNKPLGTNIYEISAGNKASGTMSKIFY